MHMENQLQQMLQSLYMSQKKAAMEWQKVFHETLDPKATLLESLELHKTLCLEEGNKEAAAQFQEMIEMAASLP